MVNGAKSVSQEAVGFLVIDEKRLGQREPLPVCKSG